LYMAMAGVRACVFLELFVQASCMEEAVVIRWSSCAFVRVVRGCAELADRGRVGARRGREGRRECVMCL
jgi:hypothetical protein